jgi:multisubunit Na+/H+ antiporter MnhC subunit
MPTMLNNYINYLLRSGILGPSVSSVAHPITNIPMLTLLVIHLSNTRIMLTYTSSASTLSSGYAKEQ